MDICIRLIEAAFRSLPFAFLEAWGGFAYIAGLALALAAFGGFTFRAGGGWSLGRERQAWDAKTVLSIPITFVLILATGYLGSSIVLVPGAQTFESLKDLTVFVCILIFGYPALITVPFAYGLSDLIEGVPPDFLWDWLPGYLINPACYWVAYQLIGKNPDFRRARTWVYYAAFVAVFMSLEPILWGYICAGKFTPEISYRKIASALFFTTSITWILSPFAMLAALPLARKCGMFWAEIPGHVRERRLLRKEWIWEAGPGGPRSGEYEPIEAWPIRVLILVPFSVLVLAMVGTTAYVTLHSARKDATKLATRLHEEISENILLQLDAYLEATPAGADSVMGIRGLFKSLRVAENGLALLLDRKGGVLASSARSGDLLAAKVLTALTRAKANQGSLTEEAQFRFDVITAQPVGRESWLARATPYRDRHGRSKDWMVVTAMPESYYLAGVEKGNTRAAMVFAVALMLSLAVTVALATIVTHSLRRMSLATRGLAEGDLTRRLPSGRLEEMNTLARSFNDMADRLARSFEDLRAEVGLRGERERELEASEARTRISESRFRALFENSLDGLMITSPTGEIFASNPAACRMFGRDEAEIIRGGRDLLVPGNDARLPTLLLERERTGRTQGEISMVRSDGSRFEVEIASAVYVTEEGPRTSMILRDITERKRLEEQINRAQRLESIGNLASGIAHDLNNVLLPILLALEVMDNMLTDAGAKRLIKTMRTSASRGADIVKQVLTFGRGAKGERKTLHPKLMIDEVAQIIKETFPKSIRFSSDAPPGLWTVHADPTQMHQVLLNLCVNARDAMPKGGSLEITGENVELDAIFARMHPAAKPGPFVLIKIADSGEGIPPAIKDKIFEPFFTTKDVGKGTGLGLSTVHSIVKSHDGFITLYSEVGKGTSFHIYLPADMSDPVREDADKALQPPRGEGELVLLVDDEAAIREIALLTLEANGYRVVCANDGNEALAYFSGHAGEIAAVITDIMMPNLDGEAMIGELVKLDPEVKIIAISGLAESGRMGPRQAGDSVLFLPKPFTAKTILDALRKVLAA